MPPPPPPPLADTTAPTITGLQAQPSPFNPTLQNTQISFTLSEPANYTITISDFNDIVRRTFTGSGTGEITWNWNGTDDYGLLVNDGPYTITINAEDLAGNDATPVTTNVVVNAVDFQIQRGFDPAAFNPNFETTTLWYELSEPATVTVTITDAAGATVRHLVVGQDRGGGANSVVWNGTNDGGALLPGGTYRGVITATSFAGEAPDFVPPAPPTVTIDYGRPAITAWADDDPLDRTMGETSVSITYTIASPTGANLQVMITIFDEAGNVVNETPWILQLPGTYTWTWLGTDAAGNPVPDGLYPYRIRARTPPPAPVWANTRWGTVVVIDTNVQITQSADGVVQLLHPAGYNVNIGPAPAGPLTEAARAIRAQGLGYLHSQIYDITSTPNTFDPPALLMFSYDPALYGPRLQLYRFNPAANAWNPVPNQFVDVVNNRIIAEAVQLSIFAILSLPPDRTPPVSFVENIEPYWQNELPFMITAQATDDRSGVENVALWYRYSDDNVVWGPWVLFGIDDIPPWSWSFTAPNGDGHYEFYTVGVDRGGNIEKAREKADARAGVDTTPPESSVNPISPHWQKSLPLTITAQASDALSGAKEVMLFYRYSADNLRWSGWKLYGIDGEELWSWEVMPENDGYYEFGTIAIDRAGNVEQPIVESKTLTGAFVGWYAYNLWTDYGEWSWSEISGEHMYGYDEDGADRLDVLVYPPPLTSDEEMTVWVEVKIDGPAVELVEVPLPWDSLLEARFGPVTIRSIRPAQKWNVFVDEIYGTAENPNGDGNGNGWNGNGWNGWNGWNGNGWNGWDGWEEDEWDIPIEPEPREIHKRYEGAVTAKVRIAWPEATASAGVDTKPPESLLDPITPYWRNAGTVPFEITAVASDAFTGVENVELLYRYSLDNLNWSEWRAYRVDDEAPWSWEFNAPEGDGFYEFVSIARDRVGNAERMKGVVSFIHVDGTISTISSPPTTEGWRGLAWDGGDKIYMRTQGELWSYSISRNTWTRLTAMPASGASFNSLVWADGYLFALRGYWADPKHEFWRYSISANRWESMASTPIGIHRGALVWTGGDHIYTLDNGGIFLRYSISSNRWDTLSFPSSMQAADLAWDGRDHIYAILERTYYSLELWRYTISSDSWVKLETISGVTPVQAPHYPYPITMVSIMVPGDGYLYLAWQDGRIWRYELLSRELMSVASGIGTTWDAVWNGESIYTDGGWKYTPSVVTVVTGAMCGVDTIPPTSSVDPISPYWKNSGMLPFEVSATASDHLSGVGGVELWYRYSVDNLVWEDWVLYDVDNSEPYSWTFDTSNGDGYYEFYSVATDRAGNREISPGIILHPSDDTYINFSSPAINFGSSPYLLFNVEDGEDDINRAFFKFNLNLPAETTIVAATLNIYQLDEDGDPQPIEVRAVENDEWTESTLTWKNQPSYGDALDAKYTSVQGYRWLSWDVTSFVKMEIEGDKQVSFCLKVMEERAPSGDMSKQASKEYSDITYHPYLLIITPSDLQADALAGVDTTSPTSSINPIEPYWQNAFMIPFEVTAAALDELSGVARVEFWYRYSSDNLTWGQWDPLGVDEVKPWELTFSVPRGDGFYEFSSMAIDAAGNAELLEQVLVDDFTAPLDTGLWSVGKVVVKYDDVQVSDGSLRLSARAAKAGKYGAIYAVSNELLDLTQGWVIDVQMAVPTDNAPEDFRSEFYLASTFTTIANPHELPDWLRVSASVNREGVRWMLQRKRLSAGVGLGTLYTSGPTNKLGGTWRIAINGENFAVWLDGQRVENWRAHELPFTSAHMYLVERTKVAPVYTVSFDHVRVQEFLADVRIGVDTSPPESSVNPIEPYWQETLPFGISATASDALSGVASVELYYRSSINSINWTWWKLFGTDDTAPYEWSFTAPDGYALYEFYSVATDVAGNVEGAPEVADASCGVVIPATIDIDPDTLNLRSQGRWITAYIELPGGFDVANIDVSTVALEGDIFLEGILSSELHPAETGDYDSDGVPDMMVKFDRSAVQELVSVGDNVKLMVVGKWGLAPFRGSDNIRVIEPGEGQQDNGNKPEVPPGQSGGHPGQGQGPPVTPPGQGGQSPSQGNQGVQGNEGGQQNQGQGPPQTPLGQGNDQSQSNQNKQQGNQGQGQGNSQSQDNQSSDQGNGRGQGNSNGQNNGDQGQGNGQNQGRGKTKEK